MISAVTNVTPLLLFVLAMLSVGLATAAEEAESGKLAECNHKNFESLIENFVQPIEHLHVHFKPLFASVSSWAASFDQHVCRDQLQPQVREVYRCVFNACLHCLDLFRSDAVERKDYAKTFLLHDLEFYLPDPDRFGEAVQFLCEIKAVPLLCLEDKEAQEHMALCWLQESQKAALLAEAADLHTIFWNMEIRYFYPRNADPLLNMDKLKSAICTAVKSFQSCVVDRLRRCPQTMLSFVEKLLGFFTPPICQSKGITKGNTDQRKLLHFSDEF